MGGIHRHDNGPAIVRLLIAICLPDDLRQQSISRDLDRVRDHNRSSGFVIDFCSGGFWQEVGNVLDQRTLAIDI